MRPVPDMPLSILGAWVVIVLLGVACYWVVRWWKKRHPPARPKPELPHAQRLQRRYNQRRAEGGSRSRAAADRRKGANRDRAHEDACWPAGSRLMQL